MRTIRFVPCLALALATALPAPALAQDADEPPETRVITMAKFQVPPGEDRQKVMRFIDEVIAPQAQNNPHVLTYRIATHYYGSNSTDIVIIAEYPDWESVEAPCGEPCQTWAEENIPEEGTPEREEWNDRAQTWTRYFVGGHTDEVYGTNMRRGKN